MQELSRNPPSSIEELKSIVEGFAASLDPTEVNKAVRSITKRAQPVQPKMEVIFNTCSSTPIL